MGQKESVIFFSLINSIRWEGLVLIYYGIVKHCNQNCCHCAPKSFHIDMSSCFNHDCLKREDNKRQQLLGAKYVSELFILSTNSMHFLKAWSNWMLRFSSPSWFLLQLVNKCANNLNTSYRCNMRIMHIPITFAVKHKIEMNKNEQYGWSKMLLSKFWFRKLCIGVMLNVVIGRSLRKCRVLWPLNHLHRRDHFSCRRMCLLSFF